MSKVWPDFVTAALLGSEKATAPELPPAIATAVELSADAPKPLRLLTEAGALSMWRRAGWVPPRETSSIAVAAPETLPLISRASTSHLRDLLSGRFATLLPEWLALAAQRQRRIPPELIPALLEATRNKPDLKDSAFKVSGERAAWLAELNPRWRHTSAASVTLEDWDTGTRDQRIAVLRWLRQTDPGEARIRLEATWKVDGADLRTAFLSEFLVNLSNADIPFLEGVLDDRSKEVRRAATDLLARLPESPFVGRMTERAKSLLQFGKTAEIKLPEDPDAAAQRDGLDPKAFGTQKILGGKAVVLVLILTAVPLSHWTASFGKTPAQLLAALKDHEFARAVVTGWARAAVRQRDAAWAQALLEAETDPYAEFLPGESLLALVPDEERAAKLVAMLETSPIKMGAQEAWQSFAKHLETFEGDLPVSLARAMLAALRYFAREGVPYYGRSFFEGLFARVPPPLLSEAAEGWATEKEGISQLLDFLTFRHEALLALNQA